MILDTRQRQALEEAGMTRAEMESQQLIILQAIKNETSGRVTEVLQDQYNAICESERLAVADALRLFQGKFLLNALARCHFYRSPREMLQGFYNWIRNEENQAQVDSKRHNKY